MFEKDRKGNRGYAFQGDKLIGTVSIWRPMYTITPKAARLLMDIEAARVEVEHMPLPPTVEAELRRQARVRSTHYSTRIEGNRLTLAEAEKVIQEEKTDFKTTESRQASRMFDGATIACLMMLNARYKNRVGDSYPDPIELC